MNINASYYYSLHTNFIYGLSINLIGTIKFNWNCNLIKWKLKNNNSCTLKAICFLFGKKA